MAIVSFSLLFPLTVAGQPAPVLSYPNAITDQRIYLKPPLPMSGPGSPGFGSAGTVYTDPVFGSRILRVTDPNVRSAAWYSQPDPTGYSVPANADLNSWASDDRAFIVYGQSNGARYLFSFDATNFTATPLAQVPFGSAFFSFQNPHLIYGVGGSDGATIQSWDYTTGVITSIFDLNDAVPGFPGFVGDMFVSADDNDFAVAFGGIQDTFPYELYYQRSTNTFHLLNLANSTLDGQPTNIPLSIGVHASLIDMTGRYVQVSINGTLGQLDIWDTQTGQLTATSLYNVGHWALGYGQEINQALSNSEGTGGNWDSRGFTLRPLSNINNPSTLQNLITPPPPYGVSMDSHLSWVTARQGESVPFCNMFYGYNLSPYNPYPWATWADEIDCIATDGSGVVWRIAQTRDIYNKVFDSAGLMSLSQDGRYIAFTSDWEQTLDPAGQRVDVFLVDATSAHRAGNPAYAPPTTPTGLTATPVSATAINLAWTASQSSAGIAGYRIYRDGNQVGTSAVPSYADAALSPSTTYSYYVVAYDTLGGASGPSSPSVSATTLPLQGPTSVFTGWGNGWKYRTEITINHAQVSGKGDNSANLALFPVQINLTNANWKNAAKADGSDMVFTDSQNTMLNYEIESFDAATGALNAWVEAPSLSPTADTVLYLYYGNPAAPNNANPGKTWGNSYRAVWHLGENPAGANPQFNDSTGYGATLTGWNGPFMIPVNSPVGNGIWFFALDKYNGAGAATARNVDLSGPASTVSGWVQMDSLFGDTVNFAGTGSGAYPDNVASLYYSSFGALGYQIFQINEGTASVYAAPPAAYGQWYYIAGTFDGSTVKIYVNGALKASAATNNITAVSGPDPAWLAYDPNSSYYVSTALAEVHLASAARSADWIQTEYNNQSAPSLFLAVASQQTYTPSSP